MNDKRKNYIKLMVIFSCCLFCALTFGFKVSAFEENGMVSYNGVDELNIKQNNLITAEKDKSTTIENIAVESSGINGTSIKTAIQKNLDEEYTISWNRDNYDLNHVEKIYIPEECVFMFFAEKPIDERGKYKRISFSIYDEEETILGGSKFFYSESNLEDYYTYFIPLQPGVYYINITPEFFIYSGTIQMDYSYSYFVPDDDYEREPNNSLSTATNMRINNKYCGFYGNDGVIDNLDDEDWFKVDLIEGEVYFFCTHNNANFIDTTLIITLYDGNYEESVSNGLTYSRKYIDDYIYYPYVAQTSGTAYIRMYNYSGEQFEYDFWIHKNYDSAEDFVNRLYEVCLDRTADADGLRYWMSALRNNECTGISAAAGFIFSEEFINKNLCNEDFVKQLYIAFLGREYDQDGLNYWVSQLESGMKREEVFNGFALSNEFNELCDSYEIVLGDPIQVPTYGTVPLGKCSICGKESGITSFVKRMYRVCLDRESDNDGLDYWSNTLWAKEKTGKEVAFGFIFSREFQSHNYNDSDYVEYLYSAFFGRHSDAEGKDYWIHQLSSGKTREDVFNGFVGSVEFDNICKKYGIKRD